MKVPFSRTAVCRISIRIAVLILFAALCLPMASELLIAVEAERTVAELLRQYEQSLVSYKQFKGEWKCECTRVTHQGSPGEYYDTGSDHAKETRFSKIWRDNERERILVTVDRGKGMESPIETVCVKDKQWLKLTQIAVTAKTRVVPSDFANAVSLATPEMSFGTIFGEDLPSFVAPLALSLRKDGSNYYVITGQPRDHSFDIELWFDSTQSDTLAKAKYTSHSAFDPSQDGSERRLNYEWTFNEFQRIGGVLVPSHVIWKVLTPSYRMEGPSANTFITLPPTEDVFESSMVSIEFSPKLSDKDLEPASEIANGTPVYMLDARHLTFEWQSGKIVPAGTKAMKTLHDSKFVGGPGSWRFGLTFFNTLALVALISYFAVRHWRKTRVQR